MEIQTTLRMAPQFLLVLIFSYTAQVLMKKGVNLVGPITWSRFAAEPILLATTLAFNWYILSGILLAGLGAVFYLIVLSKTELTVAAPIMGAVAFILLPLIGKVFLQEVVTPMRILGTFVIAAGMLIIIRS
jgi:drug/metabolite transporter (DMT)-like permease